MTMLHNGRFLKRFHQNQFSKNNEQNGMVTPQPSSGKQATILAPLAQNVLNLKSSTPDIIWCGRAFTFA